MVGFASDTLRPGSTAAASSGTAVTVPATGSTTFARVSSGIGGRSDSPTAAGATSGVVTATRLRGLRV